MLLLRILLYHRWDCLLGNNSSRVQYIQILYFKYTSMDWSSNNIGPHGQKLCGMLRKLVQGHLHNTALRYALMTITNGLTEQVKQDLLSAAGDSLQYSLCGGLQLFFWYMMF